MPIHRHGDLLHKLTEMGVLRPFDAQLGRCLLDLDSDADPALGLIAASASLAVAQGHSCLPLAHLRSVLMEACADDKTLPALPDVPALSAALHASHLAALAEDAAIAPLLYDAQERVWLGRYYHYERDVAQVLVDLLARQVDRVDGTVLRNALQPFFTMDAKQADWQAIAAVTGLVSPLTVITGGPGTGKTTTVLWLLAALVGLAHAQGQPLPRIRLAAPTGKAAARLGESLQQRLPQCDLEAPVREAIPIAASTLHRLLGSIHGSTRFRHHRRHPLDVDVVVIDEVSMVDLPLMAKLLDALPAHARLVLLGDRDQLASVEAGNVLAAICAAAGTGEVSPARA
ncbi:MAG: AAA family ATPase, partial [Xanthomonadales bacterium]|nr:AAA family ATPase [Xanthomonadales bacterium]